MNFINNMKIGLRLNIILSLVMVVIISALGIYTLNSQKKKVIEDTDLRMFEQVEDLSEIIELQIEESQVNAKKSLDFAVTLMNSYGGINLLDEEGEIVWNLNNQDVKNSNAFVDEVAALTNASVTIFEKRNEGYKRISTSVINTNGTRAIGTVVSYASEVSQSINNGQNYYGRAIVVDEWNITAYAPIWNEGQIIGMIGVGYEEKDLHGLRKIFKAKKYFDSGYPFMVDNTGTFIIHPTKEGENSADAEFFQQLISSKSNEGKTYYLWEGRQKYQYFKYVESIESYVSVSLYEDELLGIIESIRRAILIAVVLGILIFILVNTQVSKTITRALNKGVDFASKIAEGNLKTNIDIIQKDEIGMLASALNRMVDKLREIVVSINLGANNVASASQQISSSTQQLSEGATEQASSTEEVSSSMEEMTSNIQQNTDNAQQTEKISINASEGIAKVASAAQESLTSIRQIAEKITIVNDIAFQTNILALNAAVEAARAGEHGKGFAVVASEVRKLAERSKVAADEIINLSTHSVKVTEEAGGLMEKILPDIEKTAKLVQEISAASLEQNSGADQVNNAIQQLNTVTQQNAAASEEMATSSEELASQAEQLKDIVGFFKVEEADKKAAIKSNLQEFKPKAKPTHEFQIKKEKPLKEDNKGVNIKLSDNKNLDSEFESF